MKRTIHGLNLVLLVLHIHLIKHPLLIKIKMTTSLPQFNIRNMRRINNIVPIIHMRLPPKILNLRPHSTPLRMPKHQSTPRILLNRKQTQLRTQRPMIPLLRLLHHLLIPLQLRHVVPRRGVHTLQHLTLLIPPPIRPRDALQRHGFLRYLTRGLHMRTRAEIPPFVTNMIYRNRFRLNPLQNFKFERFVNRVNTLHRFLARDFLARDRIILGNYFIHLFLHFF
mmetsp:Transcript_16138/g.20092  ORF Transcript_16138/g.20092 Transcript_16138/m.20092 type:complete len:224 (+) Transcript_16138:1056-1727(+)